MKRGVSGRFARITVCAFMCALVFALSYARADVRISEISAANKTLYIDDLGNYTDYVELYNSSFEAVSLEGYALSDGDNTHVFGADVTLPARGYIVLPLSGRSLAGGLHVPFKLSSGVVETVSLYAPDGALAETVVLPPMGADMAFSRQPDGAFAIARGTPGGENAPGEAYDTSQLINQTLVLPPMFSHPSGFYDTPISLTLAAPGNCRVYYTLDCVTPTAESSEYVLPIEIADASANADKFASITGISLREHVPPSAPVDKATVVRAIAVDAHGNQSQVVTNVYFVGYGARDMYSGIAVASLVTDPENLFDPAKGIYVLGDMYNEWLSDPDAPRDIELTDTPANYFMSGREWERPATLTYFDSGHELRLTQPIGIRMHGNYSRDQLQKSFNLYARKEYGAGTFKYDFFNGYTLDTLMLRAARNTDEYLRDALTQSFVDGLNVGIQHCEYCILFIDGEYWGVYELREKQNARYVSELYGVEEDNVVLIKNSRLDEGSVFGLDAYKQLISFVKSSDFNDDEAYARLNEMIDMDSYIDYVCAEIFTGNVDWPNNNELLWRTMPAGGSGYDDGRWRWLIFDFDQTMGYASNPPTLDSLSNAKRSPMFASLWSCARFRNEFLRAFSDIANTRFHPDATLSRLAALNAYISPRVDAQKLRFSAGYSAKQRALTVADYASFAEGRFKAIAPLLAPDRPLCALALSESFAGAADWRLSGEELILSGGEWRGQYFYGREVSVSARAREGFHFVCWELNGAQYSLDADITLTMSGACALRAVFIELSGICALDTPYAAGGAQISISAQGEMAVTSPSGWALNDGVEFTLCTAGVERPEVYFTLSGGKKAPRDWALEYSFGGEAFTRVPGGSFSVMPGEALRARVRLPDECADELTITIKLVVDSGYCVNGAQKLFGSSSGEAALSELTVRGAPAPLRFAELNALIRALGAWQGEYPCLDDALAAYPPGDAATQADIDSMTRALTLRAYTDMLTERKATLAGYARYEGVRGQLAINTCADAPVYTVTREMSALGERAPIPAPYPPGAQIYVFDGQGLFEYLSPLRLNSPGECYLPSGEGEYLILPDFMRKFTVSAYTFAPYELTDERLNAWFSGVAPRQVASLTLDVVDDYDGNCALGIDSWEGGAVAYIYRARGDALEYVGEGAYALGELKLNGVEGGEYVVCSQSTQSLAALAARRADGADAPKRDIVERALDLMRLAAWPLAGALAVLILILVFRGTKAGKNT